MITRSGIWAMALGILVAFAACLAALADQTASAEVQMTLLWEHRLRLNPEAPPVLDGRRVLAGVNQAQVKAFDLASGRQVFEYDMADEVHLFDDKGETVLAFSPLLHEDYLILVSGLAPGSVLTKGGHGDRFVPYGEPIYQRIDHRGRWQGTSPLPDKEPLQRAPLVVEDKLVLLTRHELHVDPLEEGDSYSFGYWYGQTGWVRQVCPLPSSLRVLVLWEAQEGAFRISWLTLGLAWCTMPV